MNWPTGKLERGGIPWLSLASLDFLTHMTILRDCSQSNNIVVLCFGDHRTKEMLGVVGSKLVSVSNFAQQLPTTYNNMQQDVQTDVKCDIQQCWEMLANNVAFVCPLKLGGNWRISFSFGSTVDTGGYMYLTPFNLPWGCDTEFLHLF